MTNIRDNTQYREDVRLKVKNDHGIELSEDDITLCQIKEERAGLSFFHGHIWPMKRRYKKDGDWLQRITWEETIDGIRVLARRNGLCGIGKPIWLIRDDQESKHNPQGIVNCEVSVFFRGPDGDKDEFTGVAYYDEYVQLMDEYSNGKKTGSKIPNSQWRSSPRNQLSIAAERQALRKAGLDVTEDSIDLKPIEEPGEPTDIGPTKNFNFINSGPEQYAENDKPQLPPADPKGKVWDGVTKADLAPGHMLGQHMIVLADFRDNDAVVALDNGEAVKLAVREEFSIEMVRRQRKDEIAGGRDWVEREAYYDGTPVVSYTPQTDGTAFVLLKDGTRAMLDRWGKELVREKHSPVESIRNNCIPLLKSYCQKNEIRISFKQAYEKLVREVNGEMGEQEYTDLYFALKREVGDEDV